LRRARNVTMPKPAANSGKAAKTRQTICLAGFSIPIRNSVG